MSRMFLAVATGSLMFAQLATAAPANQIQDVQVRPSDGRVDLVLKTRSAPTFQSYAKRSPSVVIVDVIDAGTTQRDIKPPAGSPIEAITLTPQAGDVARLTLRLRGAVQYDVTASSDAVTVSIFGDDVADAAPLPALVGLKDKTSGARVAALDTRDTVSDAPPRLAQDEGSAGMSTGDSSAQRAMTYVGFRDRGNGSEVFARLNAQATFEVKREGPNLLVLEIKNSTIPLMNNRNHLDTTFFENSPVKMITPTEVEDSTPTIRIIIEMKEDVPYKQEVRGKEITVVFQK